LERLREGFGYDEIAREEKLTERRVRQIVTETLEGREALEKVDECRREAAAEAAAAATSFDRSPGADGNPDIVPRPLPADLQPALPSPDPSAGAENCSLRRRAAARPRASARGPTLGASPKPVGDMGALIGRCRAGSAIPRALLAL